MSIIIVFVGIHRLIKC